ncbi:MAG TPA: EamA family transporter [Actinomycetota bacterium]
MNPNPPVIDPEAHEAHLDHLQRGQPQRGRKNRMMLIGLILMSVAFAALAQLTLKHGMNQVAANSGELHLNAGSLRDVVTTPAVWGGLFLFGLSAFVWLAVLSRASLSFAYPFASLSYVLILLADRFVLHEQIPPLRWAGVFFIMTGIVLVAQTPHS